MKKDIFSLLMNWLFLLSTIVLIIHQITQKIYDIRIPLLDNYGDDFFAMPFILTLFTIEQYIWKRRTTTLSIFEIGVFTMIFGVFFEFIVPLFNNNYTKDYWDFAAYVLGSFAFVLFSNKVNDNISDL